MHSVMIAKPQHSRLSSLICGSLLQLPLSSSQGLMNEQDTRCGRYSWLVLIKCCGGCQSHDVQWAIVQWLTVSHSQALPDYVSLVVKCCH